MNRWTDFLKIFTGVIILFVGVYCHTLLLPLSWAQQEAEKPLSTQGTLTEVNQEEKFLRLKNEGGLELTFLIMDTTQILAGETPHPLADLAVGDSVKVDYDYNENYEKVIRSITKTVVDENPRT